MTAEYPGARSRSRVDTIAQDSIVVFRR